MATKGTRTRRKIIENDMLDYLGTDVFEGGCFFLNMLVELSGQSASMSKQILRGFVRLSGLLRSGGENPREPAVAGVSACQVFGRRACHGQRRRCQFGAGRGNVADGFAGES